MDIGVIAIRQHHLRVLVLTVLILDHITGIVKLHHLQFLVMYSTPPSISYYCRLYMIMLLNLLMLTTELDRLAETVT